LGTISAFAWREEIQADVADGRTLRVNSDFEGWYWERQREIWGRPKLTAWYVSFEHRSCPGPEQCSVV
jgi:hypothetical protein